MPVYQFPEAAITKYHKLGGFNNRNFLSHSSGGQKPKINASAGLVTSVGCEGKSVPFLSHCLWWSAVNFCHSLACRSLPSSLKTILPVHEFVSKFPSFTLVMLDQGSMLLQYDFMLTKYTCNNPTSKKHHIVRYWGLGLQHNEFWKNTIQPLIKVFYLVLEFLFLNLQYGQTSTR